MNMLLSLAAILTLAAMVLWLTSGILLRAGGLLLTFGGLLITASTGAPTMAAASILGGLAWLAGHWLFALRHHYFRSPLARRIFLQALPAPLDPTRGWGLANIPPGSRR
jgi:hypothetical protein